ncbi:MAG: hypothetical protein HY711_02980 [Candidatus Melainabacteria bacterium]|nr:hypothetical protein [Candidatus Melainabacteria bacterium]
MTQSSDLTDGDIAYVCNLAIQAGELAARMREGVQVREKTGPHDLVTEADCELSRLLSESIQSRFVKDTVVSEEDTQQSTGSASAKTWLIDPIDGTDNYLRNDGQYSVMVGLIIDQMPVFGWVYAPASGISYFGGPGYGAWKSTASQARQRYERLPSLDLNGTKRVMMGFRDRKSHPWVLDLPNVQFVKSGSIGLKIARILDNEADMFVHLSGKLKVWDTAGPVAIALGAGLEVGQLVADGLPFNLPSLEQRSTVVIGRANCLSWCRRHLLHS